MAILRVPFAQRGSPYRYGRYFIPFDSLKDLAMLKHIFMSVFAGLMLSPSAYAAPKKSTKPTTVPAKPASSLNQRIDQLIPLIKGQVAFEQYFSPTFLAAVPPAQLKTVIESLITQYGQPLRIVSATKNRANGSTVKLAFEKGIATVEIDAETATPGYVIGLLFSGFEVSGDSMDAIKSEFQALPGSSGFVLAELPDNGQPRIIATHNPGQQFAIGSTFKLYILAELAAQVKAGERRWSDVVPLTNHSFSSTATQGWPKDSPVTLYTLAGWMISVSDNGATDTLLFALGREAVERKLATIGHSAPDKTLPFLSTVEAFALKADPELRGRFLKATEAQQRDLLTSEKNKLTLEKVMGSSIGGAPAAIDTIEWFASPYDLLTLMRHIRRQQDDQMLSIMGINAGLGKAFKDNWRYAGYKGGSEPGVISMSYLLQSKSGKWYVVSGSWNDTKAEVDQNKFTQLISRLAAQADK
jgi:beta-lactamase class A